MPSNTSSSNSSSDSAAKPSCGHALGVVSEATSTDALKTDLADLAQLIANVTEAYSVSIFLADDAQQTLSLSGFHSLSRDFISDVSIPFGAGLVGWTAENKVRISVSPFDNDSTTLLYYKRDQSLKSFVAVPVLSGETLIGVIACDSKKSYAFAKITEKILNDCAKQTLALLNLHKKLSISNLDTSASDIDLIHDFGEHLLSFDSEDDLLEAVTKLPLDTVRRDALVVMTCDTLGSAGTFYSSKQESQVQHRLLKMVYRHKRVLADKSVLSLPVDDASKRSFLSVPFHCLGKESGSINVLSFPETPFLSKEVEALEAIASYVGRGLERIRLLETYDRLELERISTSWHSFKSRGSKALAEAQANRQNLMLSRFSIGNLDEIEHQYGYEEAQQVVSQFYRLLDQIVRPPSLLTKGTGVQALILSSPKESEKIRHRLERLIKHNTSESLRNAELRINSSTSTRAKETLEELVESTQQFREHISLETKQRLAS